MIAARNLIDPISQTMALGWHESLEAAVAEARRTKRPILSLALLGRLDEERSCANSRFFRLCLYPDPSIASLLREKLVLHWKSVRRVPRVTIDFGEGRVLERTVTGNSAHLILDGRGRPVDAIPGLLGPSAFHQAVTRALAVAREVTDLSNRSSSERLRAHHGRQHQALLQRWAKDLEQLGRARAATAARAALDRQDTDRAISMLEATTELATWPGLAALHAENLSPESRALLPDARQAGRIAVTKLRVEDPLLNLVRPLETAIAEDTARNQYQLHRRIHERFASSPIGEREALVHWIYTDIFKMPLQDPWLGLAGDDIFTALA